MAPKFKIGDKVRLISGNKSPLGDVKAVGMTDVAAFTGGGNPPPMHSFKYGCTNCEIYGVISGRRCFLWEHDGELDPAFQPSTATQAVALVKPKLKVGDKVFFTPAYKSTVAEYLGKRGKVLIVGNYSATLEMLDDVSTYVKVGSIVSAHFEQLDFVVEQTQQQHVPTSLVITLKDPHAKPMMLNTPCCGYCGHALTGQYSPKYGVKLGCTTHGIDVPVVQTDTKTKRHP